MRDYFKIFEKAIAYQNKQRKENGEPAENICYFPVQYSESVCARKIKKGIFKIGLIVPNKRAPETCEVITKDSSLLDIDPFKKYCIESIILDKLRNDKELAVAVYDY